MSNMNYYYYYLDSSRSGSCLSLLIRLFCNRAGLLPSLLFRCLSTVLLFLVMAPSHDETSTTDASSSSSSTLSDSARRQSIRDDLHVATYGEMKMKGAAELWEKDSDDDDDSSSSSSSLRTTCAVCLSEVRSRDMVWELRNCSHVFHKCCLDRWLDNDDRFTCPLCRAPLMTATSHNHDHHPYINISSQQPSWAVERLLYLFADDL